MTAMIDTTKPDTMIGCYFVWRHNGVLYKCDRYDAAKATYYFKNVTGPEDEVSCLYSFVSYKMIFIRPQFLPGEA